MAPPVMPLSSSEGAPGHREDQSPTRGHGASTWGSQCQPAPFPVCWADPTLVSVLGPGPQNPLQIHIYSRRRTSPAVLSLLVSRRRPGCISFWTEGQRQGGDRPEGWGRTGSLAQSCRCEVPCPQGGGILGPQCGRHSRLPLVCLQEPPPSSTAPSWAVLRGSPALGDPRGSARGGPEGETREVGEGTGPLASPRPPSWPLWLLVPAGCPLSPGGCVSSLLAQSPEPLLCLF